MLHIDTEFSLIEHHGVVLLMTFQEAVKCRLASRQLLPPLICVRRLSKNLLLLEAKTPLLPSLS